MKRCILAFCLLFLASTLHAECFNASEITASAPSPFAAAPTLEKALQDRANSMGWTINAESANSSTYYIIGKIGVTKDDSVHVCIEEQASGGLAFQTFPSKQGKENAGLMPLNAIKK